MPLCAYRLVSGVAVRHSRIYQCDYCGKTVRVMGGPSAESLLAFGSVAICRAPLIPKG